MLKRLLSKEMGGGSLFDIGCYPLVLASQIYQKRNPTIKYAIKTLHENDIDTTFNGILSYNNGNDEAILNFRTSSNFKI